MKISRKACASRHRRGGVREIDDNQLHELSC